MGRLEPINGTEIINEEGEIRLGHTFYEVDQIKEIIKQFDPDNFIEIGVHEGGLSWLLLQWKKDSLFYVGMEFSCFLIRPQVIDLYKKHNAKIICGNCFDKSNLDFVKELKNKIIYCDGGNKPLELLTYSKVLEQGDIIMSHDYWDEKSEVINVTTPKAEVTIQDVAFLRKSGYDEIRLLGTRIVCFIKQ